ncbi:NUDIX domain-containing protein [Paenibacillus sp. NFR01]|uniref:NUDIX hydrolase n=1 Tax=Paenibacillus sp. NFR01 TaxID=1566279 RepID=UPI0008B647C7|nr:NUDIX domain-containing protein [Paenibacillus sp. NFR01]SES93974.1 8-oxo-dGTP diphosphatase [Paenibacillus sp. NFR01]
MGVAKNNRNIVVAVKGIILHQGKFLLVKRAQTDIAGAGVWENAGGKLEFGEQLEEALKREIQEETGLDVMVERVLYAATVLTDPGRQLVVITYLCRAKEWRVVLSEEHSEYAWCTPREVKRLLPPGILQELKPCGILELEELA